MSILPNILAFALICVVVYYLSVIYTFLKDCLVSLKKVLDVTAFRLRAPKKGEFVSARMTKRMSSSKTASAEAEANAPKPMAERVSMYPDYSIYESPAYLRRHIELSF